MPTFAANLSLLFTERPLPARFAAAAEAGFEHVELLFPYEMSIRDLKSALSVNGLRLTLINTPAGDWAAGERGFMGVPGRAAHFREGFLTALAYADALDVDFIHLLCGVAPPEKAEQMLPRNLAWAAFQKPKQGLTLEPINPYDMPGYVMNDYDQAVDLMTQIGAPNISLQFDAYHAHRITGDVMGSWTKYAPHTRHIQISGHPGRHEPVGGEIDYPAFLSRLDQDGYQGVVSAEYFPAGRTEDGLDWLTRYAAHS